MTQRPNWLPPELKYSDYKGNWDKFLDDIYQIFTRDFIQSRTKYEGLALIYDSRLENGKEAAFWHIVQRDDIRTEDRVPELRRCERIPWPKPIIEHPREACISVWENTRKRSNRRRQSRVLLWFEELDYLVVLGRRPNRIVFITAYCTDIESQRKKLIKERNAYLNAKAAS